MPRYRLRFHDGPTTPLETDSVTASSDEDVRDLAHVHLLAATRFTHVEVYSGDRLIHTLKRDSYQAD
jgi:hypothetical protein